MSVKATVLIAAVGADGFPGAQAWDDSNMFQAPRGARGRHGRNSPFPAPGASGGRLDVAVRFDPNRPGLIQMTGEGPLAGSQWEASSEAEFLLNVRGVRRRRPGWSASTGGAWCVLPGDRKSTRLNSSHKDTSRMPSSA